MGVAWAGPLLGPVSEADTPGLVPPCHLLVVWSPRGLFPHLGNEAHEASPYPAGVRLTEGLESACCVGGTGQMLCSISGASTQGSLGGNGRSPNLGTRQG